jgi:hypothetical protein
MFPAYTLDVGGTIARWDTLLFVAEHRLEINQEETADYNQDEIDIAVLELVILLPD